MPESAAIRSASEVIALVVDPIAKRVWASTGSLRPSVRTPYPLAKTIESPTTIAIASPGTSQVFTACAT